MAGDIYDLCCYIVYHEKKLVICKLVTGRVVINRISKNMNKVSVILPTKNVERNIEYLFLSIYNQDFNGDIEIIVLDSSDDNTPEIAQKFPVKFVEVKEEDYNYGATRNIGASLSSGDYLVFLSADVVIKQNLWLKRLLKPFNEENVAGVFGRQYPKENANPMEKFFLFCLYPSINYSLEKDNKGKIEVKNKIFFSNTNSAIRKKVWEQIKIPEMLMSEDQEWAKRAILADYKIVYSSEAYIHHSHNYSLIKLFRRFFDSGATLPYVFNDDRIDYLTDNSIIEGLKYIEAELIFMLRHGYVKTIPYAILYDFMRFSGYFLGTKHKYLPLWMKKMFCSKRNHWEKYDDIV